MKRIIYTGLILAIGLSFNSCGVKTKSAEKKNSEKAAFTGARGEVKIITLDPGHFHATLVQKNMYNQISPEAFVYAPEGSDVKEHLKMVEAFNKRSANPTSWIEKVYTGNDYLEKMLAEKPGNVVVLAGNNKFKTDYIKKSVEAGLNVLSDKPMVIIPEKFSELEEAFKTAQEKKVLLYDIMTGRFEIMNILLREISQLPEIFGKLQNGTADQPAVESSSIHCYYKKVAGNTLVRPAWFYDVDQQGDGIVDITTHLVDFIQWGCFPNQVISKSDIEMISAKRWATEITREDFKSVTNLDEYPDYLKKDLQGDKLNVFSNGEMVYRIKGVTCKLTVEWKSKSPDGKGDVQSTILRGTNCNLEIKDGTLMIIANEKNDLGLFAGNLEKAIVQDLPQQGLTLEKIDKNTWKVVIPEKYIVPHETNFSQVMDQYLEYLEAWKLPDIEVQNMITKYYTTTSALKMAKGNK
jgi:predicted dehydrogenase